LRRASGFVQEIYSLNGSLDNVSASVAAWTGPIRIVDSVSVDQPHPIRGFEKGGEEISSSVRIEEGQKTGIIRAILDLVVFV